MQYEMNMNYPNVNFKLARAYVFPQPYRNLFTIQEALKKGTIFKDLYRPYKVKVGGKYYYE
ncbi:spore coat associated protein CotJA [Haloplasma contractile]|uniref:Spore coat associated JA protein n=1 Tax=Haloplasma contractile SSD-17B TaxID=1033810 RepID=U2FMX0_9MOLU|nr:spore coat associated protein CotJA [Haloplasma contractile]ERJ12489.1 Spore coat associated JA protein [Haloplasma contractile SSD-17B]